MGCAQMTSELRSWGHVWGQVQVGGRANPAGLQSLLVSAELRGLQALFAGDQCEAFVARANRIRADDYGRVQHAAVWHPQARLGPQLRKRGNGCLVDGYWSDAQLQQARQRLTQPTSAGGLYKRLGEREGRSGQAVRAFEDRNRVLMVGVGARKMRDDDARIQNGQAGHSRCSFSM